MYDDIKEKEILRILSEQGFRPLSAPSGKLKYGFMQPGVAYKNTLWDWDSYYMTVGMSSLCKITSQGQNYDSLKESAKGDVLNFLDFQQGNGFVPIMLRSDCENDTYAIPPNALNTHKPYLFQSALLASELNGDYSWIPFDKLEKYNDYYYERQYHERSGLFYFIDDVMIGADNNPTVFGRPKNTCADVMLNGLMAQDLKAAIVIAEKQSLDTAKWKYRYENLVKAINDNMWDEDNGFYYSQDIQVKTNRTELFHHGVPAFWNTMPLKIKMWECFLPLFAGIAPEKNAKRMLAAYHSSGLYSDYGIRTVSKLEKMYNLEPSGNPSNWLGAIWTLSNYCLFRSFLNYGFIEEARTIKTQTENYLYKDIQKTGSLSESYNPDTGERFLNNEFFSFNSLYAAMVYELNEAEKNGRKNGR